MDYRLNKEEFRKICLKKLRSRANHNRLYHEQIVLESLKILLDQLQAKNILFYWPMDSEINAKKLITFYRKKLNIYLPFMQDVSFKMVPFRLPLHRKKFGIYETGNSYKKINKVDVVIVPIVGVDRDRRRIGFGKGMYDRFFANLKYNPIKIFIQPQLCYIDKLIGDDYDIQADYLLTPQGSYSTKRKYDGKRTTFQRFYINRRSNTRFDTRFSHRKKNCRI